MPRNECSVHAVTQAPKDLVSQMGLPCHPDLTEGLHPMDAQWLLRDGPDRKQAPENLC